MSNTYALLQYDENPLSHRFMDHEGRLAFTMYAFNIFFNPRLLFVFLTPFSQEVWRPGLG